MDEIHVHKTKKSICAHFAESPCSLEVNNISHHFNVFEFFLKFFLITYVVFQLLSICK